VEAREINLTLDFCLKVGELLLSTGAGAADVTATMRNLARHLGVASAEIDVTFVNLSMSYQHTPEDVPVVSTRQVQHRAIDYEHLTRVDHLVRALLADEVDLKEARTELGRITSTGHSRPRWGVTIGQAVMSGGVAVMLGGDLWVILLAAVAAAAIDRLQLSMQRRRLPVFYQQASGAGLASLLAVAVAAAPIHVDVASAITANIVVLLAGLGFMGALQDALTGFYITACARLLEVLLSTAGIIAGVSGGLMLAGIFGIEIPRVEPGVTSVVGAAAAALGGAVSAAAFAYLSYAPGRILIPIAAIASMAVAITVVIPEEVGRAWQASAGAIFVGLVSYSVSGRMKVPPLVTLVSAVVPLLPGLSIYRGLSLLSQETPGGTSAGLLALFTAASVAVGLAAGVILGEYIAQPLKREARRLEVRLAGPRLVGPIKVAEKRVRQDVKPTREERKRQRAAERALARGHRPVPSESRSRT